MSQQIKLDNGRLTEAPLRVKCKLVEPHEDCWFEIEAKYMNLGTLVKRVKSELF